MSLGHVSNTQYTEFVNSGAKQGDPTSHLIFNLFINDLVKTTNSEH